MKRIIPSILTVMFFSLIAEAQSAAYQQIDIECFSRIKAIDDSQKRNGVGDFSCLKGEKTVNYSYEFRGVEIRGIPVEVYEEFYPENIGKTIEYLNEKFSRSFYDKTDIMGAYYIRGGITPPVFSNDHKTKFCMKIQVLTADDLGNCCLNVLVFDTENCEVVCQKYYESKGGRYGSLVNLLGDSAERLGKKVAKQLLYDFCPPPTPNENY